MAQIRVSQLRGIKCRPIENGSTEIYRAQVGLAHVHILQMGAAQIAITKIRGVQVRTGQIRTLKIAVAGINGVKVGAYETCPGQTDPLQKSAGNINAYQGHTVAVQFLQGFDSAAATALALRGVDDLPGLVVLLLQPVPSTR